jgi:hypothetical protein
VFNVICALQAYDVHVRSHWKKATSRNFIGFKLRESAACLDYDLITSLERLHPSSYLGVNHAVSETVGAAAAGATGVRATVRPEPKLKEMRCFACNQTGHMERSCPNKVTDHHAAQIQNVFTPVTSPNLPAITNGGKGDGKAGKNKNVGKDAKGKGGGKNKGKF